jgi:hypothetical protein
MAASIGEVCSVDLYALGASGTSFVRVRVKLDVNRPLTRFVGLHPEGVERLSFQVMYEKLPNFCEICGLFGHGDLECGDGVHCEADKQYGTWMVAPMEDWHPQTSGVKIRTPAGEGSRGGRGGGRGGGRTGDSRKRPPVESPNAAEKAPAGKLMLTDGDEHNQNKGTPGAKKNLDVALREVDAKGRAGDNTSPVKKPDPKRPRKGDDNTPEAGSGAERRQDQ